MGILLEFDEIWYQSSEMPHTIDSTNAVSHCLRSIRYLAWHLARHYRLLISLM